MAKRLELVWPHKGEHVLQNPETQKWEFCGSEPLLPRPLIEIESFGSEKNKRFDPQESNLLIKGENLFALQSLLPYYAGKVKLIYIDPPFNTGKDFEAYDDNFEHSVWLSMMEERLEIARDLLHDEGYIFVHIDENEISHLRVIMNEVFGPKNYQTMITWQRAPQRTVLGQGQTPIITIAEYLLCYTKNPFTKKLNRVKKRYKATDKVKSQYRKILRTSDEELIEEFQNGDNENPVRIYRFSSYDIETLPKRTSKSEYIQRFCELYQSVGIHEEYTAMQRILERLEEDSLYRIEYVPTRGKKAGTTVNSYILNQRILLPAREFAEVGEDNEIYRIVDMNNIWLDDEINVTGIAQEGNVDLKRGKKPEALLKRIVELATNNESDLVLDYVAGSSTTGAVANKMRRRWIMIEIIEEQVNASLGRLQRVIAGEDQTGISRQVNWQGGGGFRFLEVGAPVLVKDAETKLTIINPHYTNGPLVRAVCAIEGFLLTGDGALHGRNGEHYAHVTEDFVDDALVKKLKRKLKDGQFLTIYAAKGTKRGVHLPKEVRVKRVGQDLIKKYVGGR